MNINTNASTKNTDRITKTTKGGIRAKLIVILLLTCIIPVLSLGLFSYNKSRTILNNKLQETTAQTLKEVNRGIDNYFKGLEGYLYLLSNNINFKDMDIHPEYSTSVLSLLNNVKNSNPDIQAVYFATTDKKIIIYPVVDVTGLDPTTRPWWTGAVEKKDKVAYLTYQDKTTGKFVISLSKTIKRDGKIIGVISIDVNLEKLSETLAGIKIGANGYVAIIDNNGKLLAHPNKALIGTDTVTTLPIWNNMKEKANGFNEYIYKGVTKLGSFDTNNTTGWKLMGTMESSELTKDTVVIRNFTFLFLFGCLFVAVIIAIFVSEKITKNIKLLKEAFNKASNGDLSVRTNIKSKDEFRELGSFFNTMMINIGELIANVKGSADIIAKTSETITSMANESNTAINEVAITINQIATGTSEQSQSIDESVNELEKLSSKIEDISELTTKMHNTSVDTDKLSKDGLNIVEILLQKSKNTSKSTMEVNEIVSDLNNSSNEIGAITDTINQIASQTNLLALNAAIEAARAGDAGKGFSVVADEIRKLAEQSTGATKQIQGLIDNMKSRSQLAVEAIDHTKIIVNEQDKAVSETKNTFAQILNAINELSSQIEQIKIGTTETSKNKNEIIARMENISSVSEETAASTEEVSASAEEITATIDEFTNNANALKDLAKNLEKQINKFTL